MPASLYHGNGLYGLGGRGSFHGSDGALMCISKSSFASRGAWKVGFAIPTVAAVYWTGVSYRVHTLWDI